MSIDTTHDTLYRLEDFRARHGELAERHEKFLSDKVYDVGDDLLRMLLRCVQQCQQQPSGTRDGGFVYAFLALSGKIVSHAESIRLLVNAGRYGDAAAITRAMVGDVTMVQYLSLHPEDVGEWVEMSQVREATPRRGGRYGKLFAKFTESRLRAEIESRGVRPISASAYGAYSESVHPSLWGLQFYAFQEMEAEGVHSIVYAPVYQPIKALRAATVAAALVLETLESFLSWCEECGIEWHQDLLQPFLRLQRRAIGRLDTCMSVATEGHRRFYRARPTPEEEPTR